MFMLHSQDKQQTCIWTKDHMKAKKNTIKLIVSSNFDSKKHNNFNASIYNNNILCKQT